MGKLLIILSLLVSLPAAAATFKSSDELTVDPRGTIYNFVFSVRGSNVPLSVTKYSCWRVSRGKKVRITDDNSSGCFDDLASAKTQAQTDADKFESNLAKYGDGGGK